MEKPLQLNDKGDIEWNPRYKFPEPNTSKKTLKFSGENKLDWEICEVEDCKCDCHDL
jgi:hypothetical protein